MMDCLTDYDILHENSSLSSTFMVRHKPTGKHYCLRSISYSDQTENEQKALLKKFKLRISLTHLYTLQFFGHIQHNDYIYLIQEYCKHGSLASFIKKECIEKDRQLHEDLLCRILYQMVVALKTVECFMGQLTINSVLLNEEYIVKLYNFVNIDSENRIQKQKEIKMSQLGSILFELCTLKTFEKSTFEKELNRQDYTDVFKALVMSLIKDNNEIKKHLINKILCHPTVLLQSSQWRKDRCFVEKRQEPIKKSASLEITVNGVQDYSEKLEKLKRRDAALQIKEQLLNDQDRRLANKEKKLQIMERTVKEKLQQAELYLKRCREGGKSISSGSSRSSNHSQSSLQAKKMSYEDADPNYVDCGESDILPTSTKLHVDRIVKPQNFSRTMSERRIRFKTSPLKDHNFSRKGHVRKSYRHSKIIEEHIDIENIPPEVEVEQVKNTSLTRRKTLFPSYENDIITLNSENNKTPCEINKTGWTEETKKYAFEMLRIMNGNENKTDDIKHTIL